MADYIEGAHNTIRARVEQAGSLIEAADVTTIEYASYDEDGTELTALTGLTPIATYVFDEKTQADDSNWCDEYDGFNFQVDVPPASFPTGKTHITIEVKFTLADGTIGWIKEKRKLTAINAN